MLFSGGQPLLPAFSLPPLSPFSHLTFPLPPAPCQLQHFQNKTPAASSHTPPATKTPPPKRKPLHHRQQDVQAANNLGPRGPPVAPPGHHGRGTADSRAVGQDLGQSDQERLQLHGQRRNVIPSPKPDSLFFPKFLCRSSHPKKTSSSLLLSAFSSPPIFQLSQPEHLGLVPISSPTQPSASLALQASPTICRPSSCLSGLSA